MNTTLNKIIETQNKIREIESCDGYYDYYITEFNNALKRNYKGIPICGIEVDKHNRLIVLNEDQYEHGLRNYIQSKLSDLYDNLHYLQLNLQAKQRLENKMQNYYSNHKFAMAA